MTAIKSTVATNGTLTERIKQRRVQVQIRLEQEEAKRRRIAAPKVANATANAQSEPLEIAPGLLWNNFTFHTSDTNTVTYQLDRVSNFVKSLKLVLNATGTAY
jgi:hypothetical protein